MTDIIERLRIESRREPHEPIWRDAIGEIEALRKGAVGLIICNECRDKCADPYTGLFASQRPDEEPCIMCECSRLRRQLAEHQPAPDVDAIIHSEVSEFELIQDDIPVAGSSGPREEAWREIQHYAAQYSEDGPVEIYEITRRRIEGEGK